MNGIFAFLLAVLIYPGALAAILTAAALTWTRDAGHAFVTRAAVQNPVRTIRGLRAALDRDALIPDGAAPHIIGTLSLAAIVLPLLALILLPVPGNPLVSVIGMTGDLAAEAGLLLACPRCASASAGRCPRPTHASPPTVPFATSPAPSSSWRSPSPPSPSNSRRSA